MLAKQRGGPVKREFGFGEHKRAPYTRHPAKLHSEATGEHLRVCKYLIERVDWTAGNPGFMAGIKQVGFVPAGSFPRDFRIEHGSILHSPRIAREARILCKLFTPEEPGKCYEEAIICRREDNVTVPHRIDTVGRDLRMRIAHAGRI